MNPLPIGVGDSDEQRAFLQEHAAFIDHYPTLKKIVEQALCRTLAPPDQAEVNRLWNLSDDDPEVVAFENKTTTDRVVFFLGRIAADDFGEIIILSGNGRGIGAYKILRGMYERVVHAVYLNKNEEASRLFVRQSDVDKLKLATRLQAFGIDVLLDFSEQDKADLAKRAADAKNDKPMLDLSSMAERAGQSLDKIRPLLSRADKTHSRKFIWNGTAAGKDPCGIQVQRGRLQTSIAPGLLFGHNLLIHNLGLQNKRFGLGLDQQLEDCAKTFTEIWGPKP